MSSADTIRNRTAKPIIATTATAPPTAAPIREPVLVLAVGAVATPPVPIAATARGLGESVGPGVSVGVMEGDAPRRRLGVGVGVDEGVPLGVTEEVGVAV